jgi:surfeit locus 1 family protein
VTRRLVAFVALAIVLGALFVRLGVWQLDRRNERRAMNAAVSAQLRHAPVPITRLLSESDAVNRRASVAGTLVFGDEIVVTGRSRSGSPGVHILTPVRLPGRDTAVLVNRGWVYSPDAATVDLNRWREGRTSFTGFTQRLSGVEPEGAASRARASSGTHAVRVLSHPGIARLLPYPVHDLYLVARDSAARDSAPVRLDTPLLSDGPHLSYAIQWFAFAATALIGAGAVVRRARHTTRDGAHLARDGRSG